MTLTFAGTGAAESKLRSLVSEHRLQTFVHFLGPVHGAEKERLWNESDLFLLPTYHEGLPYALLESMAARTPALISPVGEIPDVMEDGVHGLFVPNRNPQALADAIRRLDIDRDLICRMGESGRQRVTHHYTSERLARDFRNAYMDAMGGNLQPLTLQA